MHKYIMVCVNMITCAIIIYQLHIVHGMGTLVISLIKLVKRTFIVSCEFG